MKLLIFGASGATGHELVRQALAQGYDVTAFVRNRAKLTVTHERLRPLEGDVQDYAAVERAIDGHDAVLSALGVSQPLKPDPAVVEGVRNVVRAMEARGVRRLVYLSFIGVAESRSDAGFMIRHVLSRVVRHEIADHEEKEQLIRSSHLDWTIVRPPKLTNGPLTGRYRTGETIAARSPLPTMSRADVAEFMLRQLTAEAAFIRKAPRMLR